MKKIILILISVVLLSSCKIEQVYEFNKDGSGNYSFGVDMSEMMKMKIGSKGSKSSNDKNIDTLFSFSKMIETHKDSISKLSSEDKARLRALKPLSIRLKVDTSSTDPKMNFKLEYKFNNFQELKSLGKNMQGQDLDNLLSGGKAKKSKIGKGKKNDQIIEMLSGIEEFESKISSSKFTYNITKKGIEKANKKKKETNKNNSNSGDNPFAGISEMIKLKQVFRFPYKIKSVSNKKYKISSDFRSIELELNTEDTQNNPKIFDVEVKFK